MTFGRGPVCSCILSLLQLPGKKIAAEMHFQANGRAKLTEMPNGRRRGSISKSKVIK